MENSRLRQLRRIINALASFEVGANLIKMLKNYEQSHYMHENTGKIDGKINNQSGFLAEKAQFSRYWTTIGRAFGPNMRRARHN